MVGQASSWEVETNHPSSNSLLFRGMSRTAEGWSLWCCSYGHDIIVQPARRFLKKATAFFRAQVASDSNGLPRTTPNRRHLVSDILTSSQSYTHVGTSEDK